MSLQRGYERQREVGGIQNMIYMIVLVRRLRNDVLNRLYCRVNDRSTTVVMFEIMTAVTYWSD